MAIKMDLHSHSKYSGDAYLRDITPQKMFDYAFDNDLDVLAVTDARADLFFDRVSGSPEKYLEGIELLDKNKEIAVFKKGGYNLHLLRGMEHHDDCGGHILQIGGERKIEYDKSRGLGDRIKYAHDEGALAGVAHPYFVDFGGADAETLERLARDADFVESFNSCSEKKYNDMATEFVKERGYVGLSNSDDHNGKPGRAHSILDVDLVGDLGKDSQAIKNAVMNGNVLGHHQSYTGFLEKVYVFVLKDVLRGDFKSSFDRVRRKLSDVVA
ncbi:hypothetical protein K8R30_00580 [archaeon]|nr:hypothetical protein [archaeon]